MKTQLITLLCCCLSLLGFSQSITDMEYFFNTDPGFGNATAITTNANTGNLTQNVSIPVGNTLTGFNNLYIRAKDNTNVWSLYAKRTFFITEIVAGNEATNIANAEYFFNADPGFGNATAITVNANSGNLTQTVSLPIGNTLTGFNNLYIRTQDDLGVWSLYEKRTFFITDIVAGSEATNIVNAEYFFNTDPGFGNASIITVDANTGILNQVLSVPVGNTLTGFNNLYIRTQDDLGVWSLYEKRTFFITENEAGSEATNIASAEYFYNTDPGFGNANAITIDANTGTLNQVVSFPVNSLEGFNTLYIRTQDDLGIWSLYEKRLFYVRDDLVIPNITAAEYFYDTDPGFGNGTAATITATGNPDEFTIDLATTDVTCDFHDFYIRLQNQDGTWSLYDYGLQIEVYDNADPTIVVFPNIIAELDANGQASINIDDVNNGTFDDCQLVSVVLNQTQFNYTCANLGVNTVTITATDAEDKVSTQDVTITVADSIDPVAISQDITIQLDVNGVASITSSQIENGSTDNCSIVSNNLDITSFTCANLGTNTVTLTVEDTSGNTNNTTAIVTLEDNINPTAITQNITVQLDVNGNATISPNMVDNSSTDNCSIASSSLDITAFTCANLGNNTITLTVTDQSNNNNSQTAIVTVEDSVNPIVVTQNITVQLDANGVANILATQIENGSTDNCTISNSNLDITSFTCNNLGANTVTLSVTDQSNNTGTATAIVTVEDSVNPTAITQNITVQLDASGNASITPNMVNNNSIDNCSIASSNLDITSFTCNDIGNNTVTLTVTDGSNNSDTETAIITVEDAIGPTIIAQNITVYLNEFGQAVADYSDIDNGTSDNCNIDYVELDIDTFYCDDLGNQTVTFHAYDITGNLSTQDVTVTVEDAINPAAITQNIVVQLDANGDATITANMIDNNSTDNCAIASSSLDITSFTCNNIGDNTVTLTVADASNNSDSETAIVTVQDNIDPIVVGQDIIVDLDGNPSITITANDVDNGSSDNCNFSLNIDADTFTMPGDYPVELTITDSFGNTTSVTVTVIVIDSSLSIEEETITKNQIKIFPVPTDAILNITTNMQIEEIVIFDLNGKKIIQYQGTVSKLDVSKLEVGMYLIRFKVENRYHTKRIIKK